MPRVRPPHSDAGQVQLFTTFLATGTRKAEEIIPAARLRAIKLVQEILDELRHATRKLEPGTARDIMRSYGVTFEALEGEIPPPGDVPVAPAPAPTS